MEELKARQKELSEKVQKLLAENSMCYNKMNTIAFDFFVIELVGEKDAREEYKEQYYRAKETHNEIMNIKKELNEIAKQLG